VNVRARTIVDNVIATCWRGVETNNQLVFVYALSQPLPHLTRRVPDDRDSQRVVSKAQPQLLRRRRQVLVEVRKNLELLPLHVAGPSDDVPGD
jgi:hypothetical protein